MSVKANVNHSSYGWIIDVDHLWNAASDDGKDDVGKIGPRSIDPAIKEKLEVRPAQDPESRRWRCKDADGIVYYEGRYIGADNDDAFGPLYDFAQPNAGATDIEYMGPTTGRWEPL